MLFRFFILSIVWGLTACQKSELNRVADPNISQSFAVSSMANIKNTGPEISGDKAQIRIKKSALEKEFLLRINSVSQDVVPMFSAGRARVIYFSKASDNLVAFESPRGFSTDVINPTARIVAVFPILVESDEEIIFDFNKGMSSLFVMDWTSPLNDKGVQMNYELVKTDSSFIADAQFDKNRLVISQWTRLGMPESSSDDDGDGDGDGKVQTKTIFKTVEFKYFLSPYVKSPTFVPRAHENQKWVGFFRGPTILDKNGQEISYSTKFDETKKIVFALSANTPEHLKPAFTDAILYWNKAFGKKVVEVIHLTDSELRAPHPDYNIIQWVEFPEASFAYADMQVDPLTGEILNGQVFMPSGFYIHSKNEAQRIVREQLSPKPRPRFAVRGFEPMNRCFKGLTPFATEVASLLEKGELSDEKIRQLSTNYLATVIAHEVGHTIGLRHNFAGNMAATVKNSEVSDLLKSYIQTNKVQEGVVFGSTVMDYSMTDEDVMTGHQVLDPLAPALSYDQAAIQTLYAGTEYDLNTMPPFCTDEDIGKYVDCWQFDTGNNSLSSFSDSYRNFLAKAPRRIFNYYKSEKINGRKVSDISYDSKPWVKRVATTKNQINMFLSPKNQMLSIAKKYDLAPGYENEIRQQSLDQTSQWISELGGLDSVYPKLNYNWSESSYLAFEKLLDSESSGVHLGKAYSFSLKEIESIKKNVRGLFNLMHAGLLQSDALMAKNTQLADHEVVDTLAEINLKTAKYFVLSKTAKISSETLVMKDGSTLTVLVPDYQYDRSVRLSALGLLSLKGRPGWALNEKEDLTEALKNELKILGEVDLKEIDWKKSSSELRRWYFDFTELVESADYSLETEAKD